MIYYVYQKSDGKYMGNGVTFFNDETHGSTTVAPPPMEDDDRAEWNGIEWIVSQDQPPQ